MTQLETRVAVTLFYVSIINQNDTSQTKVQPSKKEASLC